MGATADVGFLDTGLSQCFSAGKRWVPGEATASKAAHCNMFKGWILSAQSQPAKERFVRNAHGRNARISNAHVGTAKRSQAARCEAGTHPYSQHNHYLMSDVVRKEISEDREKSQSRYAVAGQNPGAAAFPLPGKRRLGNRLLRNRRRDIRGPIYHARNPPNGEIAAQVLASRLPASWQAGLSEPEF